MTLPDDIGKPVAVAVSAKETQLIIATYDAGSPKEYKGSFAIVDLMSKEVTLHRNVMGKCVVATDSVIFYSREPSGINTLLISLKKLYLHVNQYSGKDKKIIC